MAAQVIMAAQAMTRKAKPDQDEDARKDEATSAKGGLMTRLRNQAKQRTQMSKRSEPKRDPRNVGDGDVTQAQINMSHDTLMSALPQEDTSPSLREPKRAEWRAANIFLSANKKPNYYNHTIATTGSKTKIIFQMDTFFGNIKKKTDAKICWTRPDDDTVNDMIPLEEVEYCRVFGSQSGGDVLIDLELLGNKRGGADVVDPNLDFSALVAGNGDELHAESYVLEIHTRESGFNSGKVYFFRHADKDQILLLAQDIQRLAEVCRENSLDLTWVERIQCKLSLYYSSDPVQIIIAVLIFSNFIANTAQAELLPEDGTLEATVFGYVDDFFTWIFFFELVWNLAANFFWPFFSDGFSCFDLLVVTVSMVSYFSPGGSSGPLKTLRLMRAFRVMRLFGRLQSFRQIISSLMASIFPVCNAFMIMLLVTSIYAILGVNFFVESAPEQFGTFTRALFTMFQVCTGDGWATDLTRPLMKKSNPDGTLDLGTCLFFISFIVIVGWVLLQVVVAVLLENFTEASYQEKDRILREKSKFNGRTAVVNAIDPLLAGLAHFHTTDDLNKRIHLLFTVLDVDESGQLSFKEMTEGFRKFNVKPQINLTLDDWDTMTLNGKMLNEHEEMGPQEFEAVMKRQFKLYVQRQMSNAIEIMSTEDKGRTGTILFVLKQMVVDLESLCGTNVVENGDVPGATSPTPRQDRLGLLETKVDNMQRDMQCSLDLILQRLDSKPSAFNMPSMSQSLGVLDFGRAFGTGKGKEGTQNGETVASSTSSQLPVSAVSLAVLEETLKGRNSQNDGTTSRNTLPHFDDWESVRTPTLVERRVEICISARPTTSNDGQLCVK